jgi:hypothetical protein
MRDTLEPCVQTYGLTPTTVSAVTDQGTSVSFEFGTPSSAREAPQEPQDKAASVLFLLAQYGVSDAFYHELAQVFYSNTCNINPVHAKIIVDCERATQTAPC